MKWLGQIEGVLFTLANWTLMAAVVLIGIYVLFTEEGKRFRKAKKEQRAY
ncbi:hypothetical protein [Falsibacillus albus]|nr:hypothetical protein [Falsibacillus albus]